MSNSEEDPRWRFVGTAADFKFLDADGNPVPWLPGETADPVPFDRASHETQQRHPDGTFGPTLPAEEIAALQSRALEEGVRELPDAQLDELLDAAAAEKRRREQDPLEYD